MTLPAKPGFIIVIALLLLNASLSGCANPNTASSSLDPGDTNASPTPTPFQPAMQATPTPFQPVFPSPTGTILPTPTNLPNLPVTSTPDPAAVEPSPAPLPTLDINIQLTPVTPLDDQQTVNFLLIGSDAPVGLSGQTPWSS